MLLDFNQIIDPEEIVKLISFKCSTGLRTLGGRSFGEARLATQEEIDSNLSIKKMVEVEREGRCVAFKCTKVFPNDSYITVKLGPTVRYYEGIWSLTS
jgi:hypothetical protein